MRLDTIRTWLPPGALVGEAVRALAASTVARWAERWFTVGDVSLRRISEAVPLSAKEPGAIGTLRVSNMDALIACALDAEAEQISEADRPLLDRFVDGVKTDLLDMFKDLLSSTTGKNDLDGQSAILDIGDRKGRCLALLTLSPEATNSLVRQAVRRSAPLPKSALASRLAALQRSSVPLEARLGTAKLALQAARDLSVGDVIVLERTIEDGFDLAVAGAARGFARIDLKTSDGQTRIQMRHGL